VLSTAGDKGLTAAFRRVGATMKEAIAETNNLRRLRNLTHTLLYRAHGSPGIGLRDKDAIEKIVVSALTRHRYEMVRAMQSELVRRERTTLS